MRLKKQQIVNVSIDLVAEIGINNVSVAKIADAIGASKGKVYHYFKRGKTDIIEAILQRFDDCIRSNKPTPEEWTSNNPDVEHIRSKLVFDLEDAEAVRYRKITRIILSEMHFNEQIKQYVTNYFITEPESVIVEFFASLADTGMIAPLNNAERAARFLNLLTIVYAILDALSYPYNQAIDYEHFRLMRQDCEDFFSYILTRS